MKYFLTITIFIQILQIRGQSNHQNNITIKQTRNGHELQIAKIIFMAPNLKQNSDSQYQLNTRIENLFPSLFASSKNNVGDLLKGWYIMANKRHRFNIFMLVNKKFIRQQHHSSLNKHVFYMYFTLNATSCDDYLNHTHIPLILNNFQSNNLHKMQIDFSLNNDQSNNDVYYICLSSQLENVFFHQGANNSLLSIVTYQTYLSLWSKLSIYAVLVLLNAIFNGLNLGLMSLSVSELELLEKTSESVKEKQYARNILPLRRKGNYLLCSILLSVTLTSSVSTLVLGDLFEGLIASIISTLCLSIIGEILPQSICSKYSLEIGSYTRRFTYFFIYLTTIVSYPLGKIIDFVLGKELPTIYNIDTIKELIKKSKGLLENQCQIIHGALDLKSKTVSSIMTNINDVYMVDDEETLNFETLLNIYNSGFSRIPVYKKNDYNDIVGWFHVKDLTLCDPDDGIKVKTLLNIYKHKVAFCYNTDSLVKMFDTFRLGSTHLAFVVELVQNGDTDPYEKCVGIITLHDVFEAITSCNINDELNCLLSDKSNYGANYLKKLIKHKYSKQDKQSNRNNCNKCENLKDQKAYHNQHCFLNDDNSISTTSMTSFSSSINSISSSTSSICEIDIKPIIRLQTKLALLQILTTIKPFKEEFIDRQIIDKLLDDQTNIFNHEYILSPKSSSRHYNNNNNNNNNNFKQNDLAKMESTYLYKYNTPSDFFILLIEGCLLIEAGEEKTQFLTKQFDFFGINALLGECENVEQVLKNIPAYKPYVPEFSLKIDHKNYFVLNTHFKSLIYLKINRNTWLNAVKSTQFKRIQQKNSSSV